MPVTRPPEARRKPGATPGSLRRRPASEQLSARLLAAVETMPALVAIADCSGELRYVNPAGRALLGSGGGAAAATTLIGCIAPAQRRGIVRRAIPLAVRNGIWSGKAALIAKDGAILEAMLAISAHCDGNGRLDGLTLYAQDLGAEARTAAALRDAENELCRRAAQHLNIQEAERQRIAADLHDGLGQSLSLVSVSMVRLSELLDAGNRVQAKAYLKHLNRKIRDAIEDVRRIAMNLRPATLDNLGILATLAWYFREFESAAGGVAVEREIKVSESDIPEALKTPIFRIVQEASNNALKHAGACCIRVRLAKRRGALELRIEDDGRGFDPDAAGAKGDFAGGLGLHSMRERARHSGGNYALESAPGKGTSIRVRWPQSRSAGEQRCEIERTRAGPANAARLELG